MNYHGKSGKSPFSNRPSSRDETSRSSDGLRKIQAGSRYFFRSEEFASLTARDPEGPATKSALARLSEKGAIVCVSRRPGGWLIVPPEYSHYGAPPVDWWLHDFMTGFEPDYYLGLLSAAKYWGSAHYGLQETQVMISTPRRPIKAGKSRLVFFKKSEPGTTPVTEVSTKVARMRVSTREATLLDLVRYQAKIGGIEAIARVAKDFHDSISGKGLFEALDALDNVSCAQRLGFIFDALGMRIHANVVESWVQDKLQQFVPLSTGGQELLKDARWHIKYTDLDLRHLKEQI
jgi:predicted transcriptional regulator of viral defense system